MARPAGLLSLLPLLSTAEATSLLGVKAATLYTYVSRGLVRCVAPAGGRPKLYVAADVKRLKARSDARAGHGAVAAGALLYGEPVLDSSLTSMDDGHFTYRGRAVVPWAVGGATFEQVAEVLWRGADAVPAGSWARTAPPAPRGSSIRFDEIARTLPRTTPPLLRLGAILPPLAARDRPRAGEPQDAELDRSRRLILHLAAGLALPARPRVAAAACRASSVARAVARALGVTPSEAAPALDLALVLSADHELNISTFAGRITASGGADLYACVGAALYAMSGPLHGGACDRVEALVAELGPARGAAAALRARLARGDGVAGFGHRLYPRGDPRAPPLLAAATQIAPRDARVRAVLAIVAAMRDAGHPPPTVDVGLVALAAALGLPAGSAAALFALGRTAGWIAHVFEQRKSGELLRPRARYSGPPDEDRST